MLGLIYNNLLEFSFQVSVPWNTWEEETLVTCSELCLMPTEHSRVGATAATAEVSSNDYY